MSRPVMYVQCPGCKVIFAGCVIEGMDEDTRRGYELYKSRGYIVEETTSPVALDACQCIARIAQLEAENEQLQIGARVTINELMAEVTSLEAELKVAREALEADVEELEVEGVPVKFQKRCFLCGHRNLTNLIDFLDDDGKYTGERFCEDGHACDERAVKRSKSARAALKEAQDTTPATGGGEELRECLVTAIEQWPEMEIALKGVMKDHDEWEQTQADGMDFPDPTRYRCHCELCKLARECFAQVEENESPASPSTPKGDGE